MVQEIPSPTAEASVPAKRKAVVEPKEGGEEASPDVLKDVRSGKKFKTTDELEKISSAGEVGEESKDAATEEGRQSLGDIYGFPDLCLVIAFPGGDEQGEFHFHLVHKIEASLPFQQRLEALQDRADEPSEGEEKINEMKHDAESDGQNKKDEENMSRKELEEKAIDGFEAYITTWVDQEQLGNDAFKLFKCGHEGFLACTISVNEPKDGVKLGVEVQRFGPNCNSISGEKQRVWVTSVVEEMDWEDPRVKYLQYFLA